MTSGRRSSIQADAARVASLSDLAHLLRQLRRREARARGGRELTYRQLAARTGWSVGIIGGYFTGTALPPTDRFDTLVCLLGALPSEQGPLATARDRVDERRDPRGISGSMSAQATWPAPRGLPAARRGFVGRDGELAELDAVLAGLGDGSNRTMRIAAITGMAGTGKTALAVHWAHRVADQFPDGQLFLDLRGYDQADPVDPADALASLLHLLGVSQAHEPLGVPERAAQYRTLLADRRVLVVLDNAADPEHVRPLLPGSATCMVVVTSRDALAGLVATDGAHRVPLEPLPAREATTLLRGLVGARVDEAPEAAAALVRHCGGLPLAICIAADVAVQRSGVSLVDLTEDLAREETRLDALDTGEARTAVRSVLSWSYRALSAEARSLFRLLGYAPGPDLPLPAVASLAGIDVVEAHRLVVELTRAHVVSETAPGRYGFHDVLRAYAAERVLDEDDGEVRSIAARRLLDYYLGTAVLGDRLFDANHQSLDAIAPAEGITLGCLESEDDAFRWFLDERVSLLTAVNFAADHGYAEHTWRLASAMARFLDRSGYWQEWAAVNARALEVADSPLALAHAHRGVAWAAGRLQLFDTAFDHFRQAAAAFEELGDHRSLARVYLAMGDPRTNPLPQDVALDYQRKALELLRLVDDRPGQIGALNNLAMCLFYRGDYPAALGYAQDAFALAEQVGGWYETGATLDTLAQIQHRSGRLDDAIMSCQRALSLVHGAGSPLWEAEIRTHCGDAYADAGNCAEAENMWRLALNIYEELARPEADEVRSRLAGAPPVSRH